jgi:ribosomal protein L4
VLVVTDDEQAIGKSFRNLPKVAVVAPSELDVAAVVWARSLLVTQSALEALLARAGGAAPEKDEKDEPEASE